MSRIEVRLPAGEGVADGQTATFKLPVGRRYHEIQVDFDGMNVADMQEIRIYANGKVIHRYSGEERDSMNKFDRRENTLTGKILILPFDRHALKTLFGEEQTALNTGSFDEAGNGISSLYIEIDIKSGVTAPKIAMTATQSEKLEGGAGTVMHVQRHIRDFGGAGQVEVSDLPRGTVTSMALNRVFLVASTSTIDKVQIQRNTHTIFERKREVNTRVQMDGMRSPQYGIFTIDKTERGVGGDPITLTGVNDFRYIMDLPVAMSVKFITEYLGVLGD